MLRKIAVMMAVVMLCFSSGFADQDSLAVSVLETPTHIIYYGTITMTTASKEANHYTKAMPIIDLTGDDGFVWAICSDVTGTEDVNVLIQYSPDRTNWIATSLGSGVIIDALSTTLVGDTLSITGAAYDKYYKGARYMRLNADGQSSNPATVVSWFIVLRKLEHFEFKGFRKDNAKNAWKNALPKY